jgi:hypothetical protein
MSKNWLSPFALSACCFAAHAQTPSRVDYCNADPLSRRVADATAILVPKTQLTLNSRGSSYTLDTTPFTAPFLGNPICSDEPYYNQLRALQGRSGFLIGPHTLMTAAHGPMADGFNPADYAVVFNWRWIEDGVQPQTSPDRDCRLQNDPAAIPVGDVYFPAIFPAPTPPGDPYNTRENPASPADFMIFQLDRDVPSVVPLPLRRGGDPLLGDALIIPGHPYVLPLKLATGGKIMRFGPNGIAIGQPRTATGSSGSPVFNARAQVVETAVSLGSAATQMVWNPAHTCQSEVLINRTDNTVNNSSAKVIPAAELPTPTALQVAPLNVVRHAVAVGEVTNRTSSFTVSLPAAAPAAVNYFVEPTSSGVDYYYYPAGSTASLDVTSEQGLPVVGVMQTISPGQSRRYTTDVTSVSNDCEQSELDVRVRPVVPGAFFDSVITHRFETNVRDFIVSPDTKWTFSQFAPPYPTRTLTLRNPTALNQSITISSSANWLLVNGMASATVVIAPQGTAGDTATLTLSVASSADIDVPPGTTANARITANAGSTRCHERAAEEIDVAFTNGVLDLYVPDTVSAYLPPPSGGATYGAPIEYAFDLSAHIGTWVADVDVGAGFFKVGVWPTATIPASVMIEVDSPNPAGARHVVKVWDGNTAPAGYWLQESTEVFRLTLDDEATPPLAGTPLSAFDDEGLAGVWKVRLYNRTSDQILPEGVKLRLVRKP